MKARRVKGVDLSAALKGLQDNSCKVGFFETAKYEDGTPVAYIAAIHEFGAASRSVPPRPFMRPTIAEHRANWQSLMRSGANKLAKGGITAEVFYDRLGLQASGDVRKTIAGIKEPPLKPATVKARERRYAKGAKGKSPDKPLVDTGTLLNSVTYAVGPKDDSGQQST